ncbi:hypothetical protein DL1_08615 [Thioclava dalianensis]|uniref:Uncharacterized protein n=1 Tax=Thioclava dalianensis TaxID=1185766 RepID=A0A074TAM7_9RHOB|nr:hypothetical protein [Thioclava dalianensis]KEP68826.1 hypothetical protein DL1_08615 [Thioclava dalianensis]SFN49523.1 hypothetical protein SAMN05216224_10665 [Thioclava dalianensis]
MAKYYYPDDVVISHENGQRTARLAFSVEILPDQTISIRTEKPVRWNGVDLIYLHRAVEDIWLRARDRYRAGVIEAFLSKHPLVAKSRKREQAYTAETGCTLSDGISKYRKWEKLKYGNCV